MDKRRMRAELIFNPISGSPDESAVQLMEIIGEMQAWNLVPEAYLVDPDSDLPAAVQKAFQEGVRLFVVCGGDGTIDVLVSGIGTGGTISGVSRYIKQVRGKNILSVGVEPAASPVVTQALNHEPLQPGPHKIQGIGAGFIPDTLDLSMVDRVERVGDDESLEMARRLGKEEGILSGISCGAATVAAVRLAKDPEFAGKTIVVILPDSGERYLSTVLYEGL